ncbi:MAG: DUF3617 domain-containing protein [Nitrospira sp.]
MSRTISMPAGFLVIATLGLIPNFLLSGMESDARADSFNAKPGAWEMTHTGLSSGMLVPPEALAKMPPEQRANFEQAMHARAGQSGSRAIKSCVTKEDLDQNRIIKGEEDEEKPECATKVLSKSAGKLVIERSCPPPRVSVTHMTMEAPTPETIVASIDMERAGSGKVHIDIKGRWVGASCAGIKDGD